MVRLTGWSGWRTSDGASVDAIAAIKHVNP